MKIVIATGVFPPDLGGPAQYAKALFDEFTDMGHEVAIERYTIEKRLPVGIRHAVFFGKVFFAMLSADSVLATDTFSVGLPTVLAAKLAGKRSVIRVGGDFLWESYVETTGHLLPLRTFYEHKEPLPLKLRAVYLLTKWILPFADVIAFSTEWQRKIFVSAYGLPEKKTTVISNYFGPKEEGVDFKTRNFVWAVRPLKLKNGRSLYRAFMEAKSTYADLILDDSRYSHDELMRRIQSCYAVILPSISDVSPNLINDAIRYGKPFVLTKETGYADLLKDVAVFVDPLDELDIERGIRELADPAKYAAWQQRVRGFSYTHTYHDIAREFLAQLREPTK